MLRLVIRSTAILLVAGAVLLIVGLFDTFLGWDIFSQRVEEFLYGIFFSCLVLAVAGIALSFVLGILEIVEIMRATSEERSLPPLPKFSYYATRGLVGIAALIGLLVLLSLANANVQQHRQSVFRQLTEQQTQRFSSKIARSLPTSLDAPVVSDELKQVIETIQRSELIWSVILYLPDPSDDDALWFYDGRTGPIEVGGDELEFERLFIARRREEAAIAAMNGDEAPLQDFIKSRKFVWLELIQQGDTPSVLFLKGNEQADFRDYSFSE
ncbi:MAG: hypothetical protein AAFR31_06715 [Cyanobacteria bacterium J06627_8]